MSSAILYLAIIAIWACVLIPRWLRRDSARGSSHAPGTASDAVRGDAVPEGDVRERDAPRQDVSAEAGPGRAEVNAAADDRLAEPAERADAPPALSRQESRQRMLAARRRLLGMLLALEAAAIALAVLGLAALWVVIPPSVMLTGYLLLLREAAHADTERAAREQEAAQAREQARARNRVARRAAAKPVTSVASPAAARPAAARPAADFEDSGPGRDFAPGLAGKYTTSYAEVIPISEHADEDTYDQYTPTKLRAVGD